MNLSELLKYDNIVIQCHDNPDADAIASGWGLYIYFKMKNKQVRFIYGGKFALQKPNLILMKNTYEIPIEYVTELDKPELLLTVDCQYGEGNIQKFEADNVAVIDHHRISKALPELSEVRSNLGSCSTLVWDMLKKEQIDANDIENLSTALYYGLMTDTNNFAEISHPLDRDLQDNLIIKRSDISLFRNSNLSINELKIAGKALENSLYNKKYSYGLVEAKPCDPNILGVISDMLLEVDGVNSCLVYSILNFGIKISVRSCVKEVKANELADYIAEGIGSGGGHIDKAGGFLERELIEKAGIAYESEAVLSFLTKRLNQYFMETEIIYVKDYTGSLEGFPIYRKKNLELGYVDPEEMGLTGTTVTIRTLEGDIDVLLNSSMYIMIGINGEIYPTSKDRFELTNKYSDEPYTYPGEYMPTLKDSRTGATLPLIPWAHSCISTGSLVIHAEILDRRVKIFTTWDEEKYYLGKPGDYLVAREDNPSDVYIVEKSIFAKTYEKAD